VISTSSACVSGSVTNLASIWCLHVQAYNKVTQSARWAVDDGVTLSARFRFRAQACLLVNVSLKENDILNRREKCKACCKAAQEMQERMRPQASSPSITGSPHLNSRHMDGSYMSSGDIIGSQMNRHNRQPDD